MRLEIKRFEEDDRHKQTEGVATIYMESSNCDAEKKVFSFYTLELPYLENQFQISCIPKGEYNVEKRNSTKYKDHFHILDVPDRSYILIHAGNYKTHTKGCVLVGRTLKDINKDGFRDVTSSKDTMKKLNEILPNTFRLTIL